MRRVAEGWFLLCTLSSLFMLGTGVNSVESDADRCFLPKPEPPHTGSTGIQLVLRAPLSISDLYLSSSCMSQLTLIKDPWR